MYISTFAAIGIWDDLVQAYHGKNRYGGDTAEIYYYRIKSDHPYKSCREFVDILENFEEMYQCTILIYDKAPVTWFFGGESPPGDFHRVHVQVIKKE